MFCLVWFFINSASSIHFFSWQKAYCLPLCTWTVVGVLDIRKEVNPASPSQWGEHWRRTIHSCPASCYSLSRSWNLLRIALWSWTDDSVSALWRVWGWFLGSTREMPPYSLLSIRGHPPECPGWLCLGSHRGLLSIASSLNSHGWLSLPCPGCPYVGSQRGSSL